MELNLTEEKCQELWGPIGDPGVGSGQEKLLGLISGCKHVVVDLHVGSGKRLTLIPLRVVFPDWVIGIELHMTAELAVLIDICPQIKEE